MKRIIVILTLTAMSAWTQQTNVEFLWLPDLKVESTAITNILLEESFDGRITIGTNVFKVVRSTNVVTTIERVLSK